MCLFAVVTFSAEHKKTEAQRSRESELLQQLLVTVHRRNNIVDSIEEDRKRLTSVDSFSWLYSFTKPERQNSSTSTV